MVPNVMDEPVNTVQALYYFARYAEYMGQYEPAVTIRQSMASTAPGTASSGAPGTAPSTNSGAALGTAPGTTPSTAPSTAGSPHSRATRRRAWARQLKQEEKQVIQVLEDMLTHDLRMVREFATHIEDSMSLQKQLNKKKLLKADVMHSIENIKVWIGGFLGTRDSAVGWGLATRIGFKDRHVTEINTAVVVH